MLVVMALTLVMSSAFSTKKQKVKTSEESQFIYLIAYPGNQNNSRNYYISGIIEYQGYDVCGSNYAASNYFFGEAGNKFSDNLEKYNNISMSDWKIEYRMGNGNESFPRGQSKGFSSRSEAQNAKDDFINEHRSSEVKVFETYFTYKCK